VNNKIRILRFCGLLIVPAFLLWAAVELSLVVYAQPKPAAAHSSDVFGPACGRPSIDGEVMAEEWSTASQQTFIMQSGSQSQQLNATLHVMNSANNLYLGITIDDDEFSTIGQYLSQGDGFRIDFDNDHGGTLFSVGDEVLGTNAGFPQFHDSFVDGDPVPSSADEDVNNGGTTDGSSAASRVGNDNHFELQHPLCSGDSLDFCLKKGNVVGFRLEYLDAETNGDFGGSYFFPGSLVTSEADIVIGDCGIPDTDIYIPMILK
jgi:hypothetical protein